MELVSVEILIGFLLGTLIGVTGIGGGVVLLPVLIFGLHVSPIVAVGSDAVFNFLTKIGPSWVHLSKGTVRKRVVVALAAGSIPGTVLGVSLLAHIRNIYGAGVNDFIKVAIGVLLIVIPLMLLLQGRIEELVINRPPAATSFAAMTFIGVLAGLLVGMTSVGSGSVVMMLLLFFYSYAPHEMVGTDILHAVILSGITGSLYYHLGHVDLGLVACLVVGSIPGGLIGSHLSTRVPAPWLKRLLCALLLGTGARMLWA